MACHFPRIYVHGTYAVPLCRSVREVGYDVHDPCIGREGLGVLLPLSDGVRRRIDNCGFTHFFTGCAFDLGLTNLGYHRSAEVYWLSYGPSDRWLQYRFHDGQVHPVSKAVVKFPEQDASGNLGPNRVYEARQVVRSVPGVVRCRLAGALVHLGSPPLPEDDAGAAPPSLPGIYVDAYDVDLSAEEDWALSDIPPSGVFEVHSTLRADMDLIHDKCVAFAVEAPKNPAEVFKLALRGLDTLSEQCQLFACVNGVRGPCLVITD